MLIITDTKTVTVRRVKRFGLGAGCYNVTWRDGKRRRHCIALIDNWTNADDAVRSAVRSCYALDNRPTVIIPISAWR
jgi:hypothetical protein